jgi:uncharacterized membrane protein
MIIRESSSGLEPMDRRYLADAVLRSAVGCWLFVTAIGQWLFMYYVVAFYGPSTASGHFEDWQKKPLFKGYIPGDTVGNLSFAAHVLFAAVFSFGGVLQLVPQIRAHAIAVHRWIGRAFLVAAAMLGGSGLYMVWVRHARFHWAHSFSITLNAVLILGLVAGTWRAARVGDIDRHRRWALRTFMVANAPGVFVRVAYGAWSVFARGAGTNEGMTGPTNFVFAFGSYLLPLAVLELYLRARASTGTIARFAVAVVVVAFTAYLTVGTLAATMSRRALVG